MSFRMRGLVRACGSVLLLSTVPVSVLGQVVVTGQVTEEQSGRAVSAADVLLTDSLGRDTRRAITGEDGRFSFRHPGPGTYELGVERIGYIRTFVAVTLTGELSAEIDFTISPRPVELDPLVVSAEQRMAAHTVSFRGFAARRRRGFGDFLDREQIEGRSPSDLSDVFVGMLGVQVQGGDVGFLGTACPPIIWVDGLLVRDRKRTEYTLDQIAPSPRDVEAIEVYRRAAGVPPQFGLNAGCGVIVIWTRR